MYGIMLLLSLLLVNPDFTLLLPPLALSLLLWDTFINHRERCNDTMLEEISVKIYDQIYIFGGITHT